jgi:hypothetical protein
MPYGHRMASLKLHRQRWQAKVRIPKALEAAYEGKQFLYRHMATSDRRVAATEAAAWEAMLRMEWAEKMGEATPANGSLRVLYQHIREAAESGDHVVLADGLDPVEAGIDHEIEKMADDIGERDLTDTEGAKLAALQDALLIVQGRPVAPRREFDPTFRELADDYMTSWRTRQGLKETNTDQQKLATFDLFAGFFGKRPIRDVRKRDAAGFVDALHQMDPQWARSPKAKAMTWQELQKEFGGRPRGLSDATVNRHMATLKSLWSWAQEREFATGTNPFQGFNTKLKEGVNVQGYLPWDADDLTACSLRRPGAQTFPN